MKKTIATIVSTALCLSLAIPIPALAFDQKPTVISDNWNSIMAELDASEHGGIYIENGVLHVKPVARNVDTLAFSLAKTADDTVAIDEVADYTVAELKEAKKKISLNREELGVNSIATSNKNNSLIVTAPTWNDEKKQAVKDVAGIENIIFDIRLNNDGKDSENTAVEVDRNNTLYSTWIPYRVGENMTTRRTGGAQSLGACVVRNSQSGFITTAHGNQVGDQLVGLGVGEDADSFGIIDTLRMGGSVDAAFVRKRSTDNIPLTDKVRISPDSSRLGTITSASAPAAEGAVIRFGSTTGYTIAVILANDWEGNWNGNLDPNNYYTDMLHLDMGSQGGDSGGPCMTYKSDGTYNVVGITKGTFSNGDGLATRWDKIASAFNVSIY